jgi:hypothetical protein
MAKNIIFKAVINPLHYLAAEEDTTQQKNLLTYESFIKFLSAPDLDTDLNSIVNRYKEINQEKPNVSEFLTQF